MSSGRDEWMSRWTDEDKQRNLGSYMDQIPEEFGGVSGKHYEQLEFDFDEPKDPFDFLGKSDKQLAEDALKANQNIWRLRDEATNYILQAKAVISMVMDNIGEGGRDHDSHEFALWGATELLEKAASVLE